MQRRAVSIQPQPTEPEALTLFAESDLELGGELMLTVKKDTSSIAYQLIMRAVEMTPERQRLQILGFAIADVVGQEDEATQIRRAWEIHEAARFENLAELVPGLNPEDRQPDAMPPDPATLLGKEGLDALDGLTRFVLKQAYKRAPKDQKILYIIRIHRLLGTNGAFRQLIGALPIYFGTWWQEKAEKEASPGRGRHR